MDALATLVGCFTAVVPIVVIAGATATLDYRVSGTRQREARERAVAGVILSLGWGITLFALVAATQWLGASRSVLPDTSILALTVLPVTVGLLPSGVLLVLASGPSSGTPDRRPLWRDWADSW
ncbi:MAG: hypothetical protein R3F61_07990 [Myxococcota bacterium]